jgi:NodT family efflux transporter outer membrane factor (OMF) lipoprotein
MMITLSLTGCQPLKNWRANGFKVGPEYRRPIVKTADTWIDAEQPSIATDMSNDGSGWWRTFNDPVLEELIQTAYQQNLSVRTAGLRVLEARRQRGVVASNLFPQSQNATGSYARTRRSGNAAFGSGQAVSFDDWQTGFDLSWELDVWGRLRRAIEASDEAINIEVENYDDVLVTLIGDVAATYIQIRAFDERITLAQKNVELQATSLDIAEKQLDAGATSDLDTEQAKASLADTRALIPSLELQRRQNVNLLAILLGMTPTELDPLLQTPGAIPTPPLEVIVGIPAELLRRRPDIRAAERTIAQQSAQIGIAEAELYPQFALGGNIFLQAEHFNDLFDSDSVAGSIAPGFSWKILNYGRLRTGIEIERIRFQQAVVAYENQVLAAHQEVEDAMVQFTKTKEQVEFLREGVESTAKSVSIVQKQYREGEEDFNRVAVLQGNLVQSQDRLVAAEANIAIAITQVYKALGGGWQIRNEVPYRGNYPLSPQGAIAFTFDDSPMLESENTDERVPEDELELSEEDRTAADQPLEGTSLEDLLDESKSPMKTDDKGKAESLEDLIRGALDEANEKAGDAINE